MKKAEDFGILGPYPTKNGPRFGVKLRIKGRLWQRQGFRTKSAARALRDKIRGERYEAAFFPEKYRAQKARATSIADLLQLVVDDYRRNGRKHQEDAEAFLRFWTTFKGDTKAATVTGSMLMSWADGWMAKGTSPATVNRRMSKLLKGYRLGKDQDPPIVFTSPKWTKLKESDPRSGFLEWDTFALIRRELPAYARIPATIGFWTGMRYSEIVALLWSQVTFDERRGTVRIQLTGKTKNGHPRQVIMPGDLYETLKGWLEHTRAVACRSVCQYHGRPMGVMQKIWNTTCMRLGLGTAIWNKDRIEWQQYRGPIFHDLRRTGLRNLISAGVDRDTAKSISGHLTDSVFSRYNIVNEENLEKAGELVAAYVQRRIEGMSPSMTPPSFGQVVDLKALTNIAEG